MKKIIEKCKIIFIPICWATGIFWSLKYNSLISGHEYTELNNRDLKCDICGIISRGK